MAKSSLNLASRTAVVIGGTSGIGLALATGLAEAGADVIPTGRRPDLVERAATEIRGLGRRSLAAICDITDRASLEQFRDRVAKEFDAVDIRVNCAGITMKIPTLEVGEDAGSAPAADVPRAVVLHHSGNEALAQLEEEWGNKCEVPA